MATDLNHVVLIGRLTRDAELKYTASGMAVCKFSIAVNRNRKQGDSWVEEASFFDITLWGRSGEAIVQYLVKGKQVAINGELRQDRWEQDGQNRSKVEVIANNVQLLGGGAGQGQGSSGASWSPNTRRGAPASSGSQAGNRPASTNESSDFVDDGFVDDVPF